MIKKDVTFRTASKMIKEVMIPNLEGGVAKEQAIALLSVLKNLDQWTVEKISPREELASHILNGLEELAERAGNRDDVNLGAGLRERINGVRSIADPVDRWKQANALQCRLISKLYEEMELNPRAEEQYLAPLRRRMREQLNMELALVR